MKKLLEAFSNQEDVATLRAPKIIKNISIMKLIGILKLYELVLQQDTQKKKIKFLTLNAHK